MGPLLTDAARAWFILRWYGVDVSMLDGGWPAVLGISACTPSTTDHPAAAAAYAPPEGYRPKVGLATKESLKNQLDGSLQILDARTRAEYAGDDLRANARGGHLPGAKLLEHASLLAEDGTFKPRAELDALFANAGIAQMHPS